ncbi:MAG TPA: hypothetical protein PLJ42_05085 [Chitinophagales bacterium]|jgi:hypothetical protein|nr:hypothetical protein [Chitinophagales bacterium]MBP6154074.1 hypothetical protein [Chitinophagales bacterium]HQV78524.1 hypothetical protein [Chitinophagales bacterium]HQW78790.1 hypothetical protein [Chitinophagales bacterium]HRB19953.1 hypothetical protein [Chitinophagales bacterium]
MKLNLFLYLSVACFVFSCKKNETSAPVVSIYSPISTDSFYVSDSVFTHFKIEDNYLKTYKVIFSNYITHQIYYKEEGNTNATTFNYSQNINLPILADTLILLNVLGLDENGNTGNANVIFKMKYDR